MQCKDLMSLLCSTIVHHETDRVLVTTKMFVPVGLFPKRPILGFTKMRDDYRMGKFELWPHQEFAARREDGGVTGRYLRLSYQES